MFQWVKKGDRVRIKKAEERDTPPPHPLEVGTIAEVTLVKGNALYVIGKSAETGEKIGTPICSDDVEVL